MRELTCEDRYRLLNTPHVMVSMVVDGKIKRMLGKIRYTIEGDWRFEPQYMCENGFEGLTVCEYLTDGIKNMDAKRRTELFGILDSICGRTTEVDE